MRRQTSERVLDIAEALVQTRGFNAFSYADIARAVGIRKASLHHHFATKADLGAALVARYRAAFLDALRSIEADTESAPERLERYTDLYGSVLRKGRMCMCGMLASDAATLPKPMRESIAGFFGENEAWLARVLAEGKKRGQVEYEGTPSSLAAFFVSSLEGAMLVARAGGDPRPFDDVVHHLLGRVRAKKAAPRRRRQPQR
ncbi:MAG TPA: TetR/AcrR family transcriptional regulator [Candidatus Krumholzibacteria bacterium]